VVEQANVDVSEVRDTRIFVDDGLCVFNGICDYDYRSAVAESVRARSARELQGDDECIHGVLLVDAAGGQEPVSVEPRIGVRANFG